MSWIKNINFHNINCRLRRAYGFKFLCSINCHNSNHNLLSPFFSRCGIFDHLQITFNQYQNLTHKFCKKIMSTHLLIIGHSKFVLSWRQTCGYLRFRKSKIIYWQLKSIKVVYFLVTKLRKVFFVGNNFSMSLFW